LLSDEDGVTSYFSLNTEDMIDHIRQHQKAGHEVPVDLIELLKDDDESNFPSEEDM
jgi:hypothetical protein